MPKSKLRGTHGGHALNRGKGSVYHRSQMKRLDSREHQEVEPAAALQSPLSSRNEATASKPA